MWLEVYYLLFKVICNCNKHFASADNIDNNIKTGCRNYFPICHETISKIYLVQNDGERLNLENMLMSRGASIKQLLHYSEYK